MINARYRKLPGMHARHVYTVEAPYDEVKSPLRWMLHGEADANEKLIVSEDELNDADKWQKLS